MQVGPELVASRPTGSSEEARIEHEEGGDSIGALGSLRPKPVCRPTEGPDETTPPHGTSSTAPMSGCGELGLAASSGRRPHLGNARTIRVDQQRCVIVDAKIPPERARCSVKMLPMTTAAPISAMFPVVAVTAT